MYKLIFWAWICNTCKLRTLTCNWGRTYESVESQRWLRLLCFLTTPPSRSSLTHPLLHFNSWLRTGGNSNNNHGMWTDKRRDRSKAHLTLERLLQHSGMNRASSTFQRQHQKFPRSGGLYFIVSWFWPWWQGYEVDFWKLLTVSHNSKNYNVQNLVLFWTV